MTQMDRIEIPNLTDSQKTYNAMQTNLLSLNTAINDLQLDVKEIVGKMDYIEKVVVIGNGEISLREQTRNNTAFIADIKYWMKVIIGLFLAQFITFTTASVIAYIKFLPVLEQIANKK